MNTQLPTGTVTFLFTDIEGSTTLWQEKPAAMSIANAQHDAILRHAIESSHGYVFQVVGDSFAAAFHNAGDGLRAAVMAQRNLHSTVWGDTGEIKVRMGLHTGAAEKAGADANNPYSGYATIATAQRVMSVAYGGQVLLSPTAYDLLGNDVPAGISFKDMGEHRLKSLRASLRLYQVIAPDLPHQFPPLKSLDAFPNNLPLQLTSFVGREKEIADIEALLNTSRLVTLTGSGGTGKTRLAQEVGAQVLSDFPHGVWLIELAPLSDPAQIIPALAQVFGLRETPFNPLANVVLDYLRDKKLLLLFDNCEHLVEACARIADDLLHQCAGLHILASSREALGIAGEAAYRVPSLADTESSQLFVERARAANASFKLTDANAGTIARICRRLDGIPLAIELAAARIKLLTPEQLATRLDDRFRLLVGGSRTALPRQQTLRALIDWSYDLLSAEEKRLLQFASVFAGGWTLEAIEYVAEDPNTLELLEQLINKSLVMPEAREGEMRYFMLETIRQYAREKLFDAKLASVARDQHFAYFNELGERFWDQFLPADALPLVNQANVEFENFRTALEWGLENHPEKNIRLAANFCVVCTLAGSLLEGYETIAGAIERARKLPAAPTTDSELQRQRWLARALFMKGNLSFGVGYMSDILLVFKEAISLSRMTGDKRMLGVSLNMYSTVAATINAPDGPDAAIESLEIFSHDVDDRFGLCMAYLNMTSIPDGMINERERQDYFEKAQAMIRDMPKSYQVGMMHLRMGLFERLHGKNEEAKKIFKDGLSLFERLHNRNFKLVMMSELGHLERHAGHIDEAKAWYRETLKGWQDLGIRASVAHEMECFGFLALAEEEPQRAATLLGAAEALREKSDSVMTDEERIEYDQNVTHLHSCFTKEEFNALWSAGRLMTMEQAVQLALKE